MFSCFSSLWGVYCSCPSFCCHFRTKKETTQCDVNINLLYNCPQLLWAFWHSSFHFTHSQWSVLRLCDWQMEVISTEIKPSSTYGPNFTIAWTLFHSTWLSFPWGEISMLWSQSVWVLQLDPWLLSKTWLSFALARNTFSSCELATGLSMWCQYIITCSTCSRRCALEWDTC